MVSIDLSEGVQIGPSGDDSLYHALDVKSDDFQFLIVKHQYFLWKHPPLRFSQHCYEIYSCVLTQGYHRTEVYRWNSSRISFLIIQSLVVYFPRDFIDVI